MKPSFKQTRPEAVVNIPVATKARQVEAWLEALPLGDILASARLLSDYLRAHDRGEVPIALRKQILDLGVVSVRRVLNLLGAEFRDMPLPMDARQLKHVELAIGLLDAAGDFCKRLIVEHADRSPPLFGVNPLAIVLGRFLNLQRELIRLCHLTHRQLPDGYWRDTHQAGQLVLESGLSGEQDAGQPGSTLSDLYLAILLEAAADPYHFSEQERLWMQDVISRYGNLAAVGRAGDAPYRGIFGIKVLEDKPPFPLSWQASPDPDCELVLNTAQLVRKLALIISQLDRGQGPADAGIPVRHPGYRPLLQRLKLTWSGASQRTTARHRPVKPSLRTVVVGFHPVYRHLSGALGEAEKGAVAECQMVNESLGGMALQVAKPTFRLKIGSLVCVGRGGDDAWQDVGLVRWFKTGPNGTLTFGIKYLYGHVRPCTWSLPGDGQVYPGLLADPEKGKTRVIRNLVTPALRLDPRARIEVAQGEKRFPLALAGKAESFADLDVFRC